MKHKANIGIGPQTLSKLELPLGTFAACLNPFKGVFVSSAVLERAEMDRADFEESARSGRSLAKPCIGTFWDSFNKKIVVLNLGVVYARPVYQYRAESSADSGRLPSRVEDSASYSKFSVSQRPEALAEDAAELAKNFSGFYVIPGQSLTGETKSKKEGQKIVD